MKCVNCLFQAFFQFCDESLAQHVLFFTFAQQNDSALQIIKFLAFVPESQTFYLAGMGMSVASDTEVASDDAVDYYGIHFEGFRVHSFV